LTPSISRNPLVTPTLFGLWKISDRRLMAFHVKEIAIKCRPGAGCGVRFN
jgi:hypothetical protein